MHFGAELSRAIERPGRLGAHHQAGAGDARQAQQRQQHEEGCPAKASFEPAPGEGFVPQGHQFSGLQSRDQGGCRGLDQCMCGREGRWGHCRPAESGFEMARRLCPIFVRGCANGFGGVRTCGSGEDAQAGGEPGQGLAGISTLRPEHDRAPPCRSQPQHGEDAFGVSLLVARTNGDLRRERIASRTKRPAGRAWSATAAGRATAPQNLRASRALSAAAATSAMDAPPDATTAAAMAPSTMGASTRRILPLRRASRGGGGPPGSSSPGRPGRRRRHPCRRCSAPPNEVAAGPEAAVGAAAGSLDADLVAGNLADDLGEAAGQGRAM